MKRLLALLLIAGTAQAAEPPPSVITGTYTLPDGDSIFMAPLRATNEDGTIIRGGKNSRLIYKGPPTALGVIQFVGIYRGQIGGDDGQGFDIIIDAPDVEAAVLITNYSGDGGGRVSSGNVVKNIRVMHGGKPTACAKAFSVDSTAAGGGMGNNDHHRFTGCYAQSFRTDGFFFQGTQVHQIVCESCFAHDAGGRRPIGFHLPNGVYITLRDCGGNTNGCDVKVGAAMTSLRIENWNSENSWQFIVGETAGETFVTVDGVRWMGQPKVDLPMIQFHGPGPYRISNALFAGILGVCPTMKFTDFDPTSLGAIDLSGVMIRQHLGTIPTTPLVVTPAAGWEARQHGLKYQRVNEDGSRTKKPITINAPLP